MAVPHADTGLAVLPSLGGARSRSPPTRNPIRRSTADGSILGNQPGLYSKVNIIVSIESRPSLFNFNAGARGDLQKLFDILNYDLVDPNVLNTAVTDCTDVEEWLPNVKVNVVPPTLESLRAAIASGSRLLKPGGKCLLWFGGFGGCTPATGPNPVLFMADPSEALRGPDLRSWLMEFDASTEVYVCIDACKAGRFLDLPYVFDAKGNLLKRASPMIGPRLVCVSACHPQEFAHVVRSNREVVYGGLAWFLPRIIEEAGVGFVFLRDIERLIAPLLSDPQGAWTQRPHVEMSYRDENATFSLATIPKAIPRANTVPRS
ncbi:hypothetical protein FRB95_002798 [Tulasnella sp. JGI-2019a]|nr:hypothetical protein FRB95_002798 [Tulasnella sp. JGI-2019a]